MTRRTDTEVGTPVPPIGLGTWNMTPETCVRAVERALDAGYRHIDTAQLYGNERAVGEGVMRAEVPREDIFLATKVDPERLGGEAVVESVHESRDRLGVERIDCVYVHWPRADYDPDETLAALDGLVDDDVVESIGLSNFTPDLLDEALARTDAVVAHQVECHPLLPQGDLLEYARKDGHALVAYSPLARGEALELRTVQEVAARYGATPAGVVLAWLRAKGAVPIPKATGDHIEENLRALDLELDQAAIDRIDAIECERRLVDPDSAPWS